MIFHEVIESKKAETNKDTSSRKNVIMRFSGFEDGYIEGESELLECFERKNGGEETEEMKTVKERKKRRGGRRQRQRINALARLFGEGDAKEKTKPPGAIDTKMSRLMQELHERERIRGMNRAEARQLLQDKLIFSGDTNLAEIRLRRFCIVVISKEQLCLPDGNNIPLEVITISVEHGKVSSVLRLLSTLHDNPPESCDADKKTRYRMKTIFWNPTRVRDANMMFKMWNHFLGRCLHSLLLAPLEMSPDVLDYLRKMNKIRSVLNNRPTTSICLSKVITIEDFLVSIQEVSETNTELNAVPDRSDISLLDYCVELCLYLIESMKAIEKFEGNCVKNNLKTRAPLNSTHNIFDENECIESQLLFGPPPGLRVNISSKEHIISQQMNRNIDESQEMHQLVSNSDPVYFRDPCHSSTNENNFLRAPSFNPYISVAPNSDLLQFPKFSDFQHDPFMDTRNAPRFGEAQLYMRILQWVESIDLTDLNTSEELENIYPAGSVWTDESFSGLECVD